MYTYNIGLLRDSKVVLNKGDSRQSLRLAFCILECLYRLARDYLNISGIVLTSICPLWRSCCWQSKKTNTFFPPHFQHFKAQGFNGYQ